MKKIQIALSILTYMQFIVQFLFVIITRPTDLVFVVLKIINVLIIWWFQFTSRSLFKFPVGKTCVIN